MTVLSIFMMIFCGLIALRIIGALGGNNEYEIWKSKQSENYLMWFGHEEGSQDFIELCRIKGVTPPKVN